MKVLLLYRTIIHLRPKQLFYQIKSRFSKPAYIFLEAPRCEIPRLRVNPIVKDNCLDGSFFTFINLRHEFNGWEFSVLGNLWRYNQNYFDWLNQGDLLEDEGCKWIDRFINDTDKYYLTTKEAYDSYPTSLRIVNWVKFFCRYPSAASKNRLNSLWSQYKFLGKKIEWHLMGNHVLENAFSLYIGASFFNDKRMMEKSRMFLIQQLKEQTLSDGGHFEQSPMYHCILLDRLLDCINISPNDYLTRVAQKQLGWLNNICFRDGTYPLFNDSAFFVAPSPKSIIEYASRLGIESKSLQLDDSGYRYLSNSNYEAFIDVGNITASEQPAHSHADSLNFVLNIEGKPIVVDTGISTYNKDKRRSYERSTRSHNCVVVEGKDSSEVWSGFRVGRRCRVVIERETKQEIIASHDGYHKKCQRTFRLSEDGFTIKDVYEGSAVSYIHLAEGVDADRVKVQGAIKIEIEKCKYATEYNKFHTGTVIKMFFNGQLSYSIK